MKKHFEAMKKAGLSLALFAFISVLLVAITNNLSKPKIIENQARMLLQALNQVLPASQYDNDLAASKINLSPQQTGFPRNTPVYLARKKGKPIAAILEITTLKGYSGAITLLIGILADSHTISGVRVVKHNETPGLGDKMEATKSDWIFNFNGKSLENPSLTAWKVKKDGGDFDQFTGATITPRALVNAIRSTLLFAQKNIQALFQQPLSQENEQVTPND
jgi:electron transport complex protein RnfG